MRGQGCSEAMLLSATVQYMKVQVKRSEELRKLTFEKGMGNAEFERVYEDVAKSLNEAGIAGSSGAGAGGKDGGGDKKTVSREAEGCRLQLVGD